MDPEPRDGSHYFDTDPAVRSARATATLALPDLQLQFVTDRGVFSHGAVDAGTKLLLLEAPGPPVRGNLLDLGCGYGAIAVTVARRAPAATVWAIDVNRRARVLAEENARAAGTGNVIVVAPDDVPAGATFAAIYSNPPVRVGKRQLHALLDRWLGRLESGAPAYLVVRKDLGADSLARWLGGRGYSVARTASRAGYRVLEVRR